MEIHDDIKENENQEVLVKSEKISQKMKVIVVWSVTVLLFVITIVLFAVDYSSYKKGQKFGLATAVVTSEAAGSGWVNRDDSYAKQCKDVYKKLSSNTSDMYINGKRIDASDVRRSEAALRSSFADVMNAGGYHRYSSVSIANWFKYTNFAEYYSGYYGKKVLPKCCYIVISLAIVFTILVIIESKKEIVVYQDSVLCKIGSRMSKQVIFDDIGNVNFGKNTLKIVGTGIRFRIFNITNAEKIKSVILENKKLTQVKPDTLYTDYVVELKKYKELLDEGIISQEEFDAKKSQVLGLKK